MQTEQFEVSKEKHRRKILDGLNTMIISQLVGELAHERATCQALAAENAAAPKFPVPPPSPPKKK